MMRGALQEVVWSTASNMRLSSSRRRIKHQEVIVHLFINLHNTSLIPTPVTIVRRTENSDHFLVLSPIIPLHTKSQRSDSPLKKAKTYSHD